MDMPTAEDYIRAVQNPQLAFRQPRLKQARFDVHPLLGIPMPASGTTAIVFKATVDGQSQALRFLTRPDAASQHRYTALNHYFTERDLTRDVATSQWIDDAITVNGRPWPMLQMQWVEGQTLNNYVEDLVEAEDTASILSLAAAWRELVRRIQAARFAHGDLQHGNVLVEGDGTLRLVDFDSAWIEPFAGAAPPPESGHRNYQRVDRPWGPWMDTFPGLVVYLSLLALGRSTKAWEHLHTGENLLFSGQDFSPPYQTQTWWQLTQLSDPQLAAMADRLKVCCAPTWSATSDMETLLAAPLPWWARTGTVAKPVAPVRPAPMTPPARPDVPAAPGVWWSQSDPRQTTATPPKKATKLKLAKQQKKKSALPVSILVWLAFVAGFAALSGNYLTVMVGALVSLVPASLTYTALSVKRRRQLTKLSGRPR
jgi:eukaryotic-like serine/threonine-protein kinase